MAVPVSLVVSSGLVLVSSAYVSTRLLFVGTFIVSYIFLERVMTPERVDGFFREVDAVVLGDLRDVRDAIRNEPRTAPIYAAAEERVRRARAFVADAIGSLGTMARARLSVVKDSATAAFLWLRLAAGVANLLATVLINTAMEEARSRAPRLLRWRGVKGLRTPSPIDAPESKKDATLLVVWIAAILAYCAQAVTVGGICSSIATFGLSLPCFAALCGFALMEAERVFLWGSYEIDTTGSGDTANPSDAAGGGGVMEKDLQDAWAWLCLLTIVMHWIDGLLIAYMLGKRPFVLASLAIYNVAALKAARQACLTAGDADGAQGNVNRWSCAALKVLTIDIAKVVATYLAIDLYLGALLVVPLGAKAAFLLDRAIYLSEGAGNGVAENVAGNAQGSEDNKQESAGLDEDSAGDAQGSDDHNQESSGLVGDVAGDAQVSDDVGAENSSDIAACDHEEEEGSTTEEHSDVSDAEEQRRDESDCSSTSTDDWSFVGVDPIMPTDVNCGVDRKFRFFL